MNGGSEVHIVVLLRILAAGAAVFQLKYYTARASNV